MIAKALAKAEDEVDGVRGLTLTADGQGAVFFDVPVKDLDAFLAGQKNAVNVSLKVVTELPSLQQSFETISDWFRR
jgi:ATP-dependent RNA helicase DDX21